METLLNHQVKLDELKRFETFRHAESLEDYRLYLSIVVPDQQSQDYFYKDIAELYDLRGNKEKAAEYRSKIKDRSVLKPYVFWDWCGPQQQPDTQSISEPQRRAA